TAEIISVSTPDDHFTAGPDCRMGASGSGRVVRARGYPTVGVGIVSPTSVQNAAVITALHSSAPNDHFTAGPHCGVNVTARGRIGDAGSDPTVRAGIVSSSSAYIT